MGQIQEVLQALDKLLDLAGLGTAAHCWPPTASSCGRCCNRSGANCNCCIAIQRGIKVRFQSQDETTQSRHALWQRDLAAPCLHGVPGVALRTAPRGSALVIEHRQLGPRALIVFRDSGCSRPTSAASSSRPSLNLGANQPSPCKPRASGSASSSAGMCSLHGGQLRRGGRRQPLPDRPAHRRPARSTDPQNDIAQAQRYASDLAALMARARRKTTA